MIVSFNIRYVAKDRGKLETSGTVRDVLHGWKLSVFSFYLAYSNCYVAYFNYVLIKNQLFCPHTFKYKTILKKATISINSYAVLAKINEK